MARTALAALCLGVVLAGCSVSAAGPQSSSRAERLAAEVACPVVPDAHGIGVTVRNQLNRVITLEVTPRDVSCTLWSGVGSPTALNGVTIAPGERRGVWLSVVGNTVVGFPLTFLVDNKSVTTMPYAVQADGSEERQYIVDPQTGTPQCSRVDRWPFDIDGASAQARISCSGDLTVDIEYRL